MARFVLPAVRDYWTSERALSLAVEAGDPDGVSHARAEAMRRARTAANEVHHLADVALKSHDPTFASLTTLEDVRDAVARHCTMLRTASLTQDVRLLRDVADAFKHYKLDRKNARVVGAEAVVECQSGYGRLAFGEGKFGGVEQIVITDRDGDQRALTSVLQNVVDAWRRLLDQPVPPLNEFE